MSEKTKNISLVIITVLFIYGFSLWSILKPADAESVSERRPLATFPVVNGETISSGTFMTDFEKYALDQFPLRDRFRTLKASITFYILGQKDNNGIYIKDGHASKLEYPFDEESVEYAAERFQFVYDRYMADKDMSVYLSVIPDKNYFTARENGYLSIDYDEFISHLQGNMDFAEYIDIISLLELSDYYYTDTHWRQEEIKDVAGYLASGMGVNLSEEYTINQIDTPFYGVYYGQSALPLTADVLYYLNSPTLRDYKVYDYETNAFITIYDFEKTKGNDPYEMFLSGSKSLITIENPNADTDKELILFRDSFGSSIAPLFAEGYAKITLVDIRYISPNMLDRFIDFENQDVLFLYSVSVLNNSITIK